MGKKFTPPDQTGSWNERKGKFKQQFPILSDNDLMLEPSNREAMFENLMSKLGKTSDEMHALIIAL